MQYEFQCPKCNNDVLEEVMTGVTVASSVSGIVIENGEIDMEYHDQLNEDGTIDHYECGRCGMYIASSQETLITFFETGIVPKNKFASKKP